MKCHTIVVTDPNCFHAVHHYRQALGHVSIVSIPLLKSGFEVVIAEKMFLDAYQQHPKQTV